MPTRYSCFLFSLAALLVALWLPFPPVSQAATQTDTAADSVTYTVQIGDTLSGIAKKFGLSTAEILRANGLADRDRIAAGHVLHLPASAKAESARPVEAAAPRPATTAAVPPKTIPAKSDIPPAAVPPKTIPAKSDIPPAAVPPKTIPAKNDIPPAAVPPVAASVPVQTVALSSATPPTQLDQPVAGTYKHPSLGTIQVAKGTNGIVITKDGNAISMRHLLYATYDGTDKAGIVHCVHFVFDPRGDAQELQYSSSGTGLVTFTKTK